jgi:hypothetical protein
MLNSVCGEVKEPGYRPLAPVKIPTIGDNKKTTQQKSCIIVNGSPTMTLVFAKSKTPDEGLRMKNAHPQFGWFRYVKSTQHQDALRSRHPRGRISLSVLGAERTILVPGS